MEFRREKLDLYKQLNIIDIIEPNLYHSDLMVDESFNDRLHNYLRNPNLHLLIIESLSLGIIMTDHFAMNFAYIRCHQQYHNNDLYKKHLLNINEEYQIKIFTISSDWSTFNFNVSKLKKIYYQAHDYIIEKSLDQIKKLEKWQRDKIDINFLEALCWEPLYIEQETLLISDIDIANDNTIWNQSQPEPYFNELVDNIS
jgi:hypothetical protein